MKKIIILSIDPSGTGTSGIFIKSSDEEKFRIYESFDWTNHLKYIAALVQVYQPQVVIYEATNYVNSRGKDTTSLFKLIGGLKVWVIAFLCK